jgi:hypothetical protein
MKIEGKMVLKVGVQSARNISWYEPHELEGREPAVFTVLQSADRVYEPCGPYCVIAFQPSRYKGPRFRTPTSKSYQFSLVPRIKSLLIES